MLSGLKEAIQSGISKIKKLITKSDEWNPDMIEETICPECNGIGWIELNGDTEICTICAGEGIIEEIV
jgi:DnaJ-class molecular chaperone